jgi:hypothetical protein
MRNGKDQTEPYSPENTGFNRLRGVATPHNYHVRIMPEVADLDLVSPKQLLHGMRDEAN